MTTAGAPVAAVTDEEVRGGRNEERLTYAPLAAPPKAVPKKPGMTSSRDGGGSSCSNFFGTLPKHASSKLLGSLAAASASVSKAAAEADAAAASVRARVVESGVERRLRRCFCA